MVSHWLGELAKSSWKKRDSVTKDRLKLQGRLTSLILAAILVLLAPLIITVVSSILLYSYFRKTNQAPANLNKRILLTGGKMTKSLQLARLFHRAGYQVLLAETEKYRCSGHAYSNCVTSFHLLPDQEKGFDEYRKKIEEIVKREKVDILIPVASPSAVHFDAKLKNYLSSDVSIFHFDEEMLSMLDDKFRMCQAAKSIGLSAPEVHLIKESKALDDLDLVRRGKKYILKSVVYDPVERLNRPLLPFGGIKEYVRGLRMSEDRPWVLQEYVEGSEFCTHSVVHNGRIVLHCCCQSSDFQLRYLHVEKPEILEWIEKFVDHYKLSGQISFDFIIKADGTVMPIECNPRTHSAITCFYNSSKTAASYLALPEGVNRDLIHQPSPSARETYWLYHELWALVCSRKARSILEKVSLFCSGKEAIFDVKDPIPFLMVNHWQIPFLLFKAFLSGKPWLRIDFNIGKLVEAGGD